MRKTGRILAAAIALAFAFAAQAAPEKTVSFDVDMDIGQKLPPYEEMLKKYVADNRIVDRGYDFHWDIGNIFDSVFRMTIDYYGQTEKRIKNVHEDDLTALLSSVPPEYYQYIGPVSAYGAEHAGEDSEHARHQRNQKPVSRKE